LVKAIGLDAFFAEDVQDLNGLDSNILDALRKCDAFITVLHPRGEITRPDGSRHVRASVWIEQEIAIATYIQEVERRSLPVMAFIHKSVGREGIRELLHLNPVAFADDSDVLAALAKRLPDWKILPVSGIQVRLRSLGARVQDGRPIGQLEATLVNDSNEKIEGWDGQLRVPAGILDQWSKATSPRMRPRLDFVREVKCEEAQQRCFRFSSEEFDSVAPHDRRSFTLTVTAPSALRLENRQPPSAKRRFILAFGSKAANTPRRKP
jgi:hypothetical protein